MNELNWNQRVYAMTQKIPVGKVTTYGEIARVLGSRDARRVGWALHANSSPLVPCHRVVTKVGRVADNFAFEGAMEQRRRLEQEGVQFVDELHVDLIRYGFTYDST